MPLTVKEIRQLSKQAKKHSDNIEEQEIKARIVEPHEINKILLGARGLSPCISLTFYGTYKEKSFIAMMHWSGFRPNETADDFDSTYFGGWMCRITSQLDLELPDDDDEDETLFINGFAAVGGELKDVDENNKIITQGTFSEVMALHDFLSKHKNYTDKDCNYHIDEKLESMFKNFMAHGDESISVYARGNGDVLWCFDQPRPQSHLFRSPNTPSKRSGDELTNDIPYKMQKGEESNTCQTYKTTAVNA